MLKMAPLSTSSVTGVPLTPTVAMGRQPTIFTGMSTMPTLHAARAVPARPSASSAQASRPVFVGRMSRPCRLRCERGPGNGGGAGSPRCLASSPAPTPMPS